MANQRSKSEEIVTQLPLVEILMGHSMPHLDAIRQNGETEQSYYRPLSQRFKHRLPQKPS